MSPAATHDHPHIPPVAGSRPEDGLGTDDTDDTDDGDDVEDAVSVAAFVRS